jgi:hypothetical protein
MPVQRREWVWIAVYSLIAIVPQSLADVRFTPESGQIAYSSICPSCAKSGCEQSQQGSAPPVLLGTGWPGKNATLGPRPLINLQSAGGKREKSIVLSFRAPVRL